VKNTALISDRKDFAQNDTQQGRSISQTLKYTMEMLKTHKPYIYSNFLNSITSNSPNIYSLNYMDVLEQWLLKRKMK